jgi:aminopeptidase N
VLGEVTATLEFIHQYLSTDTTRPQLETYLRSLVQPVLAEIGLSAAPSDSDETRERRAVVVQILGNTANDEAVVSRARTALDRSLHGGAALEPTLASAIINVAASHGDDALYDELVAAADAAVSPEDHDRYLYAVTNVRASAIIDRALKRSLSSDIRNQDTAVYLARFFRNPVARPHAWSFVKEHWTALQPKIAIFGGDTNLVSALGAFCDAGSRDDIRMFFAAHPLPAAVRTLDQTIEQIDRCIDLKERQTKAVTEWLSAR